MRLVWEFIAVWMVRIAKYVSPKGWIAVTKEELIKQADEALDAKRKAEQAGATVKDRVRKLDSAIVSAREYVQKAEDALTASVEDHRAAQSFAIEQLAEANAALLAFVNGDSASADVPVAAA